MQVETTAVGPLFVRCIIRDNDVFHVIEKYAFFRLHVYSPITEEIPESRGVIRERVRGERSK